jgi:hypothetical protein
MAFLALPIMQEGCHNRGTELKRMFDFRYAKPDEFP